MEIEWLSSTRVFEGRVINLRVDVLKMGGRVVRREIVEHRGAVAAIALTPRGELVLVKQYRHAVGEELLEIPAGTLEPGETPEGCVVRELKEETGFDVESIEHVCSMYLAPGYSTEALHLFLVRVRGAKERSPDEDEDIEVVLVPFEEAVKMVTNRRISDAKSIAGILMAHELLARRP